MYVSLILFLGHLFLAVIYPRTRHSLSGMTRGWVDEDWARRNHPTWHAPRSGPGVEPSQRGATTPDGF